jgi:NAD(P)-dependent dehydrogenase (short-subunit alcohol dehydrogenase family)
MKDFAGRVAVVTGAASGIGRATVIRLAAAGMKVALAGIEETALVRLTTELSKTGHQVLGVPTDICRWEAVEALAGRTMSTFGG